MYVVEFQTSIENGVVHIQKQYQEIQDAQTATFVVMYSHDKVKTKQNNINDE